MSYAVTIETPTKAPRPAVRDTASDVASRGPRVSTAQVWTGRVLSGIAVAFLTFDAAVKLFRVPMAIEGTTQLGYPDSVIVPLGVLQIALLILYLIPRISPVGAAFWTAYLGGAVATHVRMGNPLFSHVLFPTYVATLLWAGLWLRDERVRRLLAPRSR